MTPSKLQEVVGGKWRSPASWIESPPQCEQEWKQEGCQSSMALTLTLVREMLPTASDFLFRIFTGWNRRQVDWCMFLGLAERYPRMLTGSSFINSVYGFWTEGVKQISDILSVGKPWVWIYLLHSLMTKQKKNNNNNMSFMKRFMFLPLIKK